MEKTTMEEVVSALGLKMRLRGTESPVDCPLCGKKQKMYINLKAQKAYCHHCHFGGGPLSLYMEVTGLSSKEAGKQLYQSLKSGISPVTIKAPEVAEAELAPIEVRDTAYRAMLANMPLSDRNRQDLIKRGLTEEEASRLGYGTFRFTDGIAHQMQVSNVQLKGVPGFYDDKSAAKWMIVDAKSGTIVPYLDEHRKISGVQIRKNPEDVTAGKQKYSWLSSRDREQGTGAVTSVHYACDWVQDFLTGNYSPILRKKVLLTEGAMKADIAHAVTGEPIIAVPGVSCLKALSKALNYLKSRGVEEIIDIFDMDYLTNPNVTDSMNKVKSMVISKGMRYSRRNWDVNYKGYDDYVTYMRSNS